MKRLMTAALAVTLACGVSAFAYAQDSQPATTGDTSAAAPGAAPSGSMSSPPQGTDQSGQAPQGSMNGGAASPPAAAGDQGGATPGGAAPPPAAAGAPNPGAPDASGSTMANAPDGSPPASYPACTSKSQDRCMQTGKMMKGGHHKANAHHHVAKKAMTSAPAAAPAPAPGA